MHALTSPSDALEAATERVVALDRPDLLTIALSGTDVLRYLHAVCTQHTLDLAPGDATQALLLSPKGKIEFAFRLAVLDQGALLYTEAEAAPGLAERLARFVFRYDVGVGRPVQGGATLLGPGADAALAAAGLPVPAGPGSSGRTWWSSAPRSGSTWSALPRRRPPPAWSGPGWSGPRPGSGSWSGSSTACPGPAAS